MKILLPLAKGVETMEFVSVVDIMGWGRNDYKYDIEISFNNRNVGNIFR